MIKDSIDAVSDSLSVVKSTERILADGLGSIQGRVKVVFNKGRPNERVLTVKDGDGQGRKLNHFTVDGRDKVIREAYYNDSGTRVGFIYMAVSSNPDTIGTVGNTGIASALSTEDDLEAEITADNGLKRALIALVGGRSHTVTENEVILEHTFTATADGIVDVQKAALFNQLAIGGVMGNILTFSATNMDTDDTLTLTWAVTIG